MSTVQIILTVVLLVGIVWILGTLLADACWAFRERSRVIIKLGTAGWYHSAAASEPGELPKALTTHWPAGAHLRVCDGSGRFVDVQVVRPDKPFKNTERVLLYLDRAAFVKLAPAGVNFLHVEVERLDGRAAHSPRREELKDMLG